jgi:hypothetical protein
VTLILLGRFRNETYAVDPFGVIVQDLLTFGVQVDRPTGPVYDEDDRSPGVVTNLENAKRSGKDLNKAVQELLSNILKDTKALLFRGDNYSEEWHKEAERRGLPNLEGPDGTGHGRSASASK